MSKRFTFKDREGLGYTWDYSVLGDTLFEGEAWDKPSVKKRVHALKVGQRMTIKGETLTRIKAAPRTPSKPKRKSNPKPSLADLGTMSEHGRIHELVVDTKRCPDGSDEVHSFRTARYPLLFWSPRQKALVVPYGVKMPRPRKGAPSREDGAAATFERFHNRDVDSYREEVPIPAVTLRELGPAMSIAYRNERYGGTAGKVAEHPFGPSVRAYFGSRGSEGVYIIAGGKLRMTARGIEG